MIKRKDKIQSETRSTPNKKHDLSAGLCVTQVSFKINILLHRESRLS